MKTASLNHGKQHVHQNITGFTLGNSQERPKTR